MTTKDNKKMMGYSVEDILVGYFYRSPNSYHEGQIISAEKRDSVWVGDEATAYLISYRDKGSFNPRYATISVSNGN